MEIDKIKIKKEKDENENENENEIIIIKKDDMKEIPFWYENPNILLHKEYILEFFPIDDMSYSQKLNAISRTVIVLTILSYIYSQKVRMLIIGIMTLTAIYILYMFRMQERRKLEAFEDSALAVLNKANLDTTNIFDTSTAENPLSNILLPDYDFNPNKKPAPPTSSENTKQSILENAKQLVANVNPGQPDIVDKLFTNLGDQLNFEQSMQQFVSNPNTTIPNDQTSFAEFCYGNMISCKEGNEFACARNLDRYTN